jgi:hypothetical protein
VSPCHPSTFEHRPLRRMKLLLCALQIATVMLVVKSSSTPSPPRSGRRCLYLAATLLGLPPPSTTRRSRLPRPRLPQHQRAIICMWYSPVSAPVTAYAPSRRCNYGGCQFIGFYLRLILQSHRLWCSHCDCVGMLEYIWEAIYSV